MVSLPNSSYFSTGLCTLHFDFELDSAWDNPADELTPSGRLSRRALPSSRTPRRAGCRPDRHIDILLLLVARAGRNPGMRWSRRRGRASRSPTTVSSRRFRVYAASSAKCRPHLPTSKRSPGAGIGSAHRLRARPDATAQNRSTRRLAAPGFEGQRSRASTATRTRRAASLKRSSGPPRTTRHISASQRACAAIREHAGGPPRPIRTRHGAYHAAEACRLDPSSGEAWAASDSSAIRLGTRSARSRRRGEPPRSKVTTGVIISAWHTSAGVRNGCALRTAR